MSKKEEFKAFVKLHPELIKFVKSNEMTWQKFYEIYSLYGKENSVWDKYFKDLEEDSSSSSKESFSVTDLINMVKKVDLNSVHKNITNISKALGLIQSLVTKEDTSVQTDTYTPRPLYKKFED